MPTLDQCKDFVKKFNITECSIRSSCLSSALILLPSLIHYKSTLRRLIITGSSLPTDCIEYLCQLLTDNGALVYLRIAEYSMSDKGVIRICEVLQHNSTLNELDLSNNPLITSASAPALVDLILKNSTLSELDLFGTQLSLESLELIFLSLKVNKSLRTLIIDEKHEEYCTKNYEYLLPLLQFSYF